MNPNCNEHGFELKIEYGIYPTRFILSCQIKIFSSGEELRARFKGAPPTRPRRRGLTPQRGGRPLNVGCTALSALIERLEHDSEPLTRSHALWAIAQLDQKKASSVVKRSLIAPDPPVREEARSLKL